MSRRKPRRFLPGVLGVVVVVVAVELQADLLVAAARIFLIVGWSLFAMTRSSFTILGFAVPGLCMIRGLLSLLAIGPAGRAEAARERLRRRGVSFGL